MEYYLNVDLIEQVMTERGSSKGNIKDDLEILTSEGHILRE